MSTTRAPVWRHLSLIRFKAYAFLRAEAERTYAGFLWWVAEPVLSMAVYYLVFSVILDRGGPDYVAFLFAGLVPWRFFQATVLRGANAIVSAKSLMQQVHVPKVVFPLATLLADTLKYAVVLLLLLLGLAVYGFPSAAGSPLWLPAVVGVHWLFVAAVTLLGSAVTPFVPDVRIVLQNLLRLWFFLSGVFYDLDLFSAEAQRWLRLNPMAVLLEAYRDVLLEGRAPETASLGWIALAGFAIAALAVGVIRHFDYDYPKLKL